MRYDIRKILSTSALALVLSLGFAQWCSAQGVVSLSDNAKTNENVDEIPDEISLFGDDSDNVKVITPAKSASGVKSAAELLGNAPKNANGVKSAAELLGNAPANNNGVKSAAELLGNAPANTNGVKSAAELLGNAPANTNGVKSAAELLGNANDASPLSNNTQESPAAKMVNQTQAVDIKIVKDVDNTVFDQMSDLEEQTAILNLELKKEKVKSDIESLKAIQEKAREEEQARKEEKKRKAQEWENEEKRKILKEEQKLKELEIAFEQARQEKLLNSYKNKMLEDTQKFIASRAEAYKEIAELKAERQSLISDFKGRFTQLTKLADEATSEAIRVRDNYAKTISDLQTQISILKARLEANKDQQNPFAGQMQTDIGSSDDNNVKLSDLYAVMEVRGQGNALTAKLINDNGAPFIVKVGTVLQSGHIVDEITSTYVRADKQGTKDYLYFSAGGVLEKEPIQNEDLKIKVSSEKEAKAPAPSNAVLATGIPGVAAEMTVR